jgi:hypothetical protein
METTKEKVDFIEKFSEFQRETQMIFEWNEPISAHL